MPRRPKRMPTQGAEHEDAELWRLVCAEREALAARAGNPGQDEDAHRLDTEVEWSRLSDDARCGKPAGLYDAIAQAEYAGLMNRFANGHVLADHIPEHVQQLVTELRRVRGGRPRNDDRLRAPALAWQRHEATQLYRNFLRQYQQAKGADHTGNAMELSLGPMTKIAYVDHDRGSRRSLPAVVRVDYGRQSPKEHALEATGKVVGRSADAVAKLMSKR